MQGLCANQEDCPLGAVNSGPRYSLANLEDKIEQVASSLTPSWMMTVSLIWQGLAPVGQLGGLLAIGYSLTMMAMTMVRRIPGMLRARGRQHMPQPAQFVLTPTAPASSD